MSHTGDHGVVIMLDYKHGFVGGVGENRCTVCVGMSGQFGPEYAGGSIGKRKRHPNRAKHEPLKKAIDLYSNSALSMPSSRCSHGQ